MRPAFYSKLCKAYQDASCTEAVSYTHLPEQIQINTKHDTIFKALNIENTQKTNTYTTITHNK